LLERASDGWWSSLTGWFMPKDDRDRNFFSALRARD
jgi:hypothetical protein